MHLKNCIHLFQQFSFYFPSSGLLGMDSQCDHVELHSRSRLKIRRAPSCKISASFHGSCSQKKKDHCNSLVIKPLIYHTVDPEIIKAEPAEFMWLVQRLTGSPNTRRLLRTCMRRSKEVQLSLQVQLDVQSMQSSLSPASSDPSSNTYSNPLASPLSSDTNQLKTNNPASSSSSTSAESSEIKYSDSELSPNCCECEGTNHLTASPLSTNHLASSPLISAKASDEVNNTRGPLSPTSSLTTTSEGYHTDNLSTEGGAWEALWFEHGNTSEAEEDGGINFFDFSLDCYYGNYHGAQHEVDLHHINVLD